MKQIFSTVKGRNVLTTIFEMEKSPLCYVRDIGRQQQVSVGGFFSLNYLLDEVKHNFVQYCFTKNWEQIRRK